VNKLSKIPNIANKNCIMVIISGIMTALPLTFSCCFFLSWIGFAPFFVVILKMDEKSGLRTFVGRWFLFGFIQNLCVYYWFWWLYPLDFLGLSNGLSLAIVIFAWTVVSLLHALLYVIPGILCCFSSKFLKRSVITVFSGVIGVLIALKLTELGELAFPWLRISLGNYRVPALIQSASIWGIEGVDFLILSVNALLSMAIVCESERRKMYALAAVFVFAANLGYGIIRLCGETEGRSVVATVVQGNIQVDEKWEDGSATEGCWKIYSELSEENVTDETDVVVWPETAVPVNLAKSVVYKERFGDLSEKLNIPIYMGVNLRAEEKLLNSAVLVDGKEISEPCAKRMLVPFGEKIPYRNLFANVLPVLERFNLTVSEYTADEGVQVMQTEFGKVGSIICFDSVFPKYSREIAQNQGEVFFIITNDAWLKDSSAAYQHLAHSVFRSVENSKDTVRCANVGVSAFIDSRGRIKSKIDTMESGALTDSVNLTDEKTFYNKVGYLFFPLIVIAYFVFCIGIYVCDRKAASRKKQ